MNRTDRSRLGMRRRNGVSRNRPFPYRKFGGKVLFKPRPMPNKKFSIRIKEYFTLKKILFIIFGALISCSIRLYLIFFYPDISFNSFMLLFSTGLNTWLLEMLACYSNFFIHGGNLQNYEPSPDVKPLYMDNQGESSGTGRPSKKPRQGSPGFTDVSNTGSTIPESMLPAIPSNWALDPLFENVEGSKYVNPKDIEISRNKPQDISNIDNLTPVSEEHYNGILTKRVPNRSPSPEPDLDERSFKINELNRLGRASRFFTITNISPNADSCTVTFFEGVPNPVVDKEKADLLKRLWQIFPMASDQHRARVTDFLGKSYYTDIGTLDKYRLAGRIRHDLDNACDHADWPYKSNQRKPADMSPYYDPNKAKGYYQPWASDIADGIAKYKSSRSLAGNLRPKLDSDSAIFLTTYLNASSSNSASLNMSTNIITQLRNL